MLTDNNLQFCKRLLEQLHIPVTIYHMHDQVLDNIDMGLRHTLGLETESYRKWEGESLSSFTADNVIYYMTDEFCCQYAFLRIPELSLSEDRTQEVSPSPAIFMVGPYKTAESQAMQAIFLDSREIHIRNWYPILENYYNRIPLLSGEEVLHAALNALAEQFWGDQNFRTEKIVQGIPESWSPVLHSAPSEEDEAFLTDVKALERSYNYERILMYEVSHGHTHQVQVMLSNIPVHSIANRTDPIRNLKNYSIILNTLLRKAAEQGGVHPLSIDKLSSEYAQKIESQNRRDMFFDMWSEMAQRYSQLVNKHSIEKYHPLIQKALLRIDFNLASDLSLHTIADMLNVNASYLSSLFKKELGISLTEFVNKKRIDYAIFLLTSDNQPISAIAQSCGIHDDNYFTKMFKKYVGSTPTAFRKAYAFISAPGTHPLF